MMNQGIVEEIREKQEWMKNLDKDLIEKDKLIRFY